MRFLLDTHTHSVISGHAYSTIDENIRYAASIGLELLALTDHGPGMKHTASRAFFANYHILPRKLHGIDILYGAELNIMDYNGTLDLDEEILRKLDIGIASLHPPCIPFGTKKENTNALIKAMENPYVDILGHPGDPRYVMDVDAIFQAAKDTGTMIEVNNASLIPGGFRAGSEVYLKELLLRCIKAEVPVILGSDAHFYTQIGDFSYCVKLLAELNFPEKLIINTSPQRFRESLKRSKL